MISLLSLLLSMSAVAQDEPQEPEFAATELTAPGLLELVEATYPPAAQEAGLEAVVKLEIELDDTGAVLRADVIEPVGHGFDEAAQAAVLASRFSPARAGDQAVGVIIAFEYVFELAPPEVVGPDTLVGVVKQKGTKILLSGTEVRVESGEQRFTAVTDAEGRWSLAGVPPGPATVTAVFPGHDDASATVEVRADDVAEVSLWLRARDYNDTVAVGTYERSQEVVVTRHSIGMREARAVPGTLGDPIRAVQNLPGVARPAFVSGDLIIRGANPGDSRIFIDGVEVPIVYHLGGLRSVIPAGMVESIDYLPGSYPVRYGRGGGGVVDVHTTDETPEDWEVNWRTDLLDTGVVAKGRVGKVGVSMGVRRSYIDAFLPLLLPSDSVSVSPSWFDYQFKLTGLGDGPWRWSVFAFGLEDQLNITFGEDADAAEGPSAGLQDAFGSHRIVGSFERDFGKKLHLDIKPSFSWDREDADVGSLFELSEDNLRFGLRTNLTWTPSKHLQLVPGIDMSATRFQAQTFLSAAPGGGGGPGGGPAGGGQPGDDSSIDEDEAIDITDQGWILAPDVFLEARIRPMNDPDALVFQPGIRMVTSAVSGGPFQVAADPRLAARLRLREGTTLKGGTGLHHQPVQDRVLAISGDKGLGFERTWSSEVGIEQNLWDQGSFSVTAFHRETENRFVQNPAFRGLEDDSFFVAQGRGRANGVEVLLRKNTVGPVSGFISYTLSKSERMDNPDQPGADWIPFDFDQTHIFTATGTWRLPYDLTLSGRYRYITGNPTTPYTNGIVDLDTGRYTGVLSSTENGDRLSPFSALDLRASKLWTFKSWQLEGYVDLLNVVKGKNPEGQNWAYDFSESTTVSGLPFIPSVGVQADVRF
ncbi:MAG: TonB family protein [Myxococcota bacterium]